MWQRLVIAYAILVTALVVGFEFGIRHLARLVETHPALTYGQANPVGIMARIGVPWMLCGLIAGGMFLFASKPRRKQQQQDESRTTGGTVRR